MIGESALIWKGGVQMPKTTVNITGVSLCQKKGIIRIFRSTIKELGDPRYIRFLFNPEKRTLAVQSVSRKEAECFRVPKYNPKDWDFKICSIQMLRIIWRVCEWNENDTYRIAGTCIFRKNCASVPEERSAIPLQTEQSSAGLLVTVVYSTIPARKFKTICLGCHSA